MSWVLVVNDKSGRRIHLSRERWTHILRHPEMVNQLENIEETLKNPNKIIQFEIDPAVHFYFRYFKPKSQYLFVSVKYLNGQGFIITSFYTDKIK